MCSQMIAGSLAVVVAIGAAVPSAEPGTWKAGVAKVKITPEQLMWMSGYASRTRPAEGTLHDLWAKALVLQDPTGRRIVLLTLDLVGIPRELAGAVCAELQAKHGLPREAVMLATSHTHSGPVVGSNLNVIYFLDDMQQRLVTAYARALPERLTTVVNMALADLSPATVSWGQGRATFAVNRRTNKEADVMTLRAQGKLLGPVDHDVPVLTVRNPEGQLRAVVFGYACHATVLCSYQWSGDYPGFAQLELEKTYPGAVALFWAGCGGDQNPLPRRTVALAEEYGRRLAQSVQAVVEAPMVPLQGRLAATFTEVPLPFAELPTREHLVKDAASDNKYVAARARLLLEEINKHGSLRASYPYPVQVWRLGPEVTWIALGGEVVVDYALRLKRELGRDQTWVTAYANDVMAYIPSVRVLQEGGYEGGGAMVYYGLPTVWSPRVEDIIVSTVREQVQRVRDKQEQ